VRQQGPGGTLIIAAFALSILAFNGEGSGPFLQEERRVMEKPTAYLIDDFSSAGGASALGTSWRMFTDQVMGGVSEATSNLERLDGRRCLRLRGRVSLANNGGFIQVALPLDRSGRPFDASEFKGVRAWVRGNGKSYHLHLRTTATRLPWQYYSIAFPAGKEWRSADLPFDLFRPENLETKLDPARLERIALVAIGEEFEADIAVSRLEFYR
jgi:hypothetical protein